MFDGQADKSKGDEMARRDHSLAAGGKSELRQHQYYLSSGLTFELIVQVIAWMKSGRVANRTNRLPAT